MCYRIMEENTNERKIIMFKKYKSIKGITLVALVITIIILSFFHRLFLFVNKISAKFLIKHFTLKNL